MNPERPEKLANDGVRTVDVMRHGKKYPLNSDIRQ